MALHFKMAVLLAAVAVAAVAGRYDRDNDVLHDVQIGEISHRQWQYDGPKHDTRRRSRSDRIRRKLNLPEDPEIRRSLPKEPQISKYEEETQSIRHEDDPSTVQHGEQAQKVMSFENSRRSRNRRRKSRRHDPEDPRRRKDKSEEQKRVEAKEPAREDATKEEGGRIANEIESAPSSEPPETEGLGIETTTEIPTTELSTTEISSTPSTQVPIMPPLDKRYRRIYNPDETAKIKDHPYLAAVLMNEELWCGGAIIGTDLVLTAAHCLQLQYNNRFFREYVKMLTVRVGSSNATAGGQHLSVSEIFFHPNYKPQTLEFNYAVLVLHKNITFDGNVSIIEYSTQRDIPVDKTITFLGWGSVLGMGDKGGAVLLQKVDLPVYDKADCTDIYGRELVTYSTFCAGYISRMKNVCNHDAGGPAVMDDQVVGILSFSSKRCDEPDRPAVFSSTGAAAEWLQTIPDIRKKNAELQEGWVDPDNPTQ